MDDPNIHHQTKQVSSKRPKLRPQWSLFTNIPGCMYLISSRSVRCMCDDCGSCIDVISTRKAPLLSRGVFPWTCRWPLPASKV